MALKQNSGILFLIPEVALAPQTVSRLRIRFGSEKVVVWHSHLSAGERVDSWRSLINGDSKIVVGARSAILLQYLKLRLIIVDEEHEASYKQEDTPRYPLVMLLLLGQRILEALCLLGSATPSLSRLIMFKKQNTESVV